MSGPPIISLLYTTARTDFIPDVLARWLEQAVNVEAIVTTDDPVRHAAENWEDAARGVRARFFVNDGRRDCVTGWNLAVRHAAGDILVQVSDDLHPPSGWDAELRRRLDVKKPQVLAIDDGARRDRLICHAILTRPYLDRFGYLFHPSYESMYCDRELSDVAYASGAVVEARDLLFEHRHIRRAVDGLVPLDGASELHDAVSQAHEGRERYRYGKANYRYRRAHGFDPQRHLAPPRNLLDRIRYKWISIRYRGDAIPDRRA